MVFVILLQVDTKGDWDPASEVIYNAKHPSWNQDPHHLLFLHETFTPSAQPHSMTSFGKKVGPYPFSFNFISIN